MRSNPTELSFFFEAATEMFDDDLTTSSHATIVYVFDFGCYMKAQFWCG